MVVPVAEKCTAAVYRYDTHYLAFTKKVIGIVLPSSKGERTHLLYRFVWDTH
jgi:hypothetical protein